MLCLLVPLLRISIELGQLKQAVNSLFLKVDPSETLGFQSDSQFWIYVAEALPILALFLVAYLLYKNIAVCPSQGTWKYVLAGALFNYMLIPFHWASDSSLSVLHMLPDGVKGNLIPRMTYAAGLLQLSLLTIGQLTFRERAANLEENTVVKALALLSAWSSTIIILSGKQGPLVVLGLLIGGACSTS